MSIPYKACVFDAFGTLFQLDIPLDQVDALSGGKGADLLEIWRRKQLEYTWLRSLMAGYDSFDVLTAAALRFAMDRLEVSEVALFDLLMPIYRQPKCFSTVKDMLSTLKTAGFQTAILSNGTPAMLEAGVAYSELGDWIDHILSVDEVAIFKPAPQVYELATKHLGLDKEAILFVSSNPWDVAGAGHFGFSTLWVNRTDQNPDQIGAPASYVRASLAELPALLEIG
ncbi:MAG: haloacid dehalogenase type II [Bacteroidota bacterium]